MPETPVAPPRPSSIYFTASGEQLCGICHGRARAHAPDCVVLALHAHVQEIGAQVGMLVATTRETMTALDHLLRGEPLP